jgi:proteasome lid subunit RPN8/RPN11
MSIVPYTRIVVDRVEEQKFRRRALRRFPLEYIEALWGYIRGNTLYICAFVSMNHRASKRAIWYEDQELDEHEEDAAEAGYGLLGTIHTHPNCSDARFGDTDLEQSQDTQELVLGICAIQIITVGRKERKKCLLAYWPVVRPMLVIHKDWNAFPVVKSNRKKRR